VYLLAVLFPSLVFLVRGKPIQFLLVFGLSVTVCLHPLAILVALLEANAAVKENADERADARLMRLAQVKERVRRSRSKRET
jgi:hypothetical protein